jgi:signal transduction histidine kinase/low affinity Fe/Cu permease
MKLRPPFFGISLLWRILVSTSLAIVSLFTVTTFVVQHYAVRAAEASLENEVRTSSQAYHSLWTARTEGLAAISRIISSMSDVRSAFLTHDRATIRDSAQELWGRVSQQDTILLVLSPTGEEIAALNGHALLPVLSHSSLETARKHFPAQVSGYLAQRGHLFYVVLTPVYVQAGPQPALLNILLAGLEVDNNLAASLKNSTSGSDFVFLMNSRVVASTLALENLKNWQEQPQRTGELQRFTAAGTDFFSLGSILDDVDGHPIGELRVIRSLAGARNTFNGLERNIIFIWLVAACFGLLLTYLLARQILRPVSRLDQAASQVAQRHYDHRVPVESDDELGRLALTFNEMCDSIQSAREELIRQERISTIGRLSSSIVHDLRNPLAAIYGGAEILIDSDLPPAQARRLAMNIYRASRRIQELLQDLSNVSRGKSGVVEICQLREVIVAASEVLVPVAEAQGVNIILDAAADIEIPLERARVERLFINLMNNALEAMPAGGQLNVTVRCQPQDVVVHIDDTGSGISSTIRAKLFQPFVSEGKRNGLGLGLALSRQTAIDHGGDLWAEDKPAPGARFCIRFPLRES